MGLLDDAIREHLDLKRRRGADPAEIERAEREALGPVRREPLAGEEPSTDLGPENGFDSPEPPPLDLEGAGSVPPHEGYSVEQAGRSRGHEEGFEDELEDESDYEEEEWDDYEEDEGTLEGEAAPPGRATASPSPSAAPPPAPGPTAEHDEWEADEPDARHDTGPATENLGETVAYDIEPAQRHPEPPGSTPTAPPPTGSEDDVLEETPDFLQDTPDHDRLWFEQKPPKDFDFDE